jgi:hypothetical protein
MDNSIPSCLSYLPREWYRLEEDLLRKAAHLSVKKSWQWADHFRPVKYMGWTNRCNIVKAHELCILPRASKRGDKDGSQFDKWIERELGFEASRLAKNTTSSGASCPRNLSLDLDLVLDESNTMADDDDTQEQAFKDLLEELESKSWIPLMEAKDVSSPSYIKCPLDSKFLCCYVLFRSMDSPPLLSVSASLVNP